MIRYDKCYLEPTSRSKAFTEFLDSIINGPDQKLVGNLTDGYRYETHKGEKNMKITSLRNGDVLFLETKDGAKGVGRVEDITADFRCYGDGDITITCKLTSDLVMDIGAVRRNNTVSIERVIFNNPATIVFWSDGTKTVVKSQNDEPFDPEKGLAVAISKKFLGNKGNFNNIFKKFLPEEEEVPNG